MVGMGVENGQWRYEQAKSEMRSDTNSGSSGAETMGKKPCKGAMPVPPARLPSRMLRVLRVVFPQLFRFHRPLPSKSQQENQVNFKPKQTQTQENSNK